MVKAPTTRHGKASKPPQTIDLEATQTGGAVTGAREDMARPAEPYEGSPSGSASSFDESQSVAAGHDAGMSDEARVFEAEPVQTGPAGEGGDIADNATAATSPVRSETPAYAAENTRSGGSDTPKPKTTEIEDTRPTYASSTHSETAGSSTTGARSSATPLSSSPSRDSTGGTARLVTAAIVGGVIAFLGATLLERTGILPDKSEIDPASFAQVQSEVQTLQAAGEADGSSLTELRQQIDQMNSQVTTLQNRPEPQPIDLTPIEQQLQSLQQQTQAVDPRVDTLAEQVAGFEQRIAGLEQRIEEQANDPRLTLALTASALRSAIDRGGPFQTQFDAYAAAAQDPAELEPLRALAAEGVPTQSELLAELPDAAHAMATAVQPVDTEAGFFTRLWNSATGLVSVRPVGGAVEGTTPEAVVARFEAAVRDGDYATALREYDTLPDAAKTAGDGFVAKVRARDAAGRLIDDALGQALNPA